MFDKKAYFKKYREENREKIKAHAKKHYEENREKRKAYSKKYNEENREKRKAKAKKYWEENRDELLNQKTRRNFKGTFNTPKKEIPKKLVEAYVMTAKIKRFLKNQQEITS